MLLQIIVSNGIPFELKKSSGSHRQVNVNVRRIVWNFAFALPCLAKRLKKNEQKTNQQKVARLFANEKKPFLNDKRQTQKRIPHVEVTRTYLTLSSPLLSHCIHIQPVCCL